MSAMTKDELLDVLEDERENLLEAIDGLSDEDLSEPSLDGSRSVKDILIHISAWEAELIKLLWQAKQGQQPTTIHFSQVDVDAANQAWFEAYHDRPLERVLGDFAAVRKQTTKRVESLSEDDLTNPQRFPWLNGRPLAEWIAGDSFEHDAEHAAQIKAWRAKRA
jgi:hypothetical protein